MLSADLALFHWINGFAGHSPWLDALMIACAKYAPLVFAAILLGCWATWRPRLQRAAALAGVAALLALGIGQFVGMLLPRARPYDVTQATVLVIHAPDTSFPSDHAILAFAVTVVLASASRRLGGWLALFSAVVLFSRIYIGVHYPSDVIGGALVGSLVAWGVLRLARAPIVARWIDSTFALLQRVRIAAREAPGPIAYCLVAVLSCSIPCTARAQTSAADSAKTPHPANAAFFTSQGLRADGRGDVRVDRSGELRHDDRALRAKRVRPGRPEQARLRAQVYAPE
jgi:undecaprenyl-diphosphatase